jgi:dipeptidyl aminopeptidase/acylaminoacyl peptidase
MRRATAKQWVMAVMLGLIAAAPRAEEPSPAPIPVEVFYRNADIAEARLSPSGQRLAVTSSIGERNRVGLLVFDLLDLAHPKLAAGFGETDIRSFRWVNDDTLVFDIIDLSAGSGDQPHWRSLFSVKADGTRLRQLVRLRRGGFERHAGPSLLEWNHVVLDVPEGSGDEVIVGRLVLDNGNHVTAVVPLRLNVETGRARSLAFGAPDRSTEWLFDPRGEARIAIAGQNGRRQVHWRAPGQDGWKQIAEFPLLDPGFVPHSVDASGQLLVTTVDGAAGTRVLKRFDFSTGRPEPQPLVSTPGFDFRGDLVTAGDGSAKALGVRALTDAETTVWFDSSLKKVQQAADERFPGHTNRLSCSRCGSNEMTVLVQSWSDQDPGEIWVHQPAKNSWQNIGRVRQDVDPKRMATLDLHRIRARDGLELPVWVTLPPGADKKTPRAAVVLVHDGPWARGVSWQWNRDAQFLASRGYVVIEPEFRGSTGYGLRHFRAGWKQWGLAMQDDVADALKWAHGQGWVDERKVCIAGTGYGGYSTLMGLVKHADLYRCGVAWAADTDPRLLFDPFSSDLPQETRLHLLPELIGDPKPDAGALAAASPVLQAARIKAPLLLAYGRDDKRVPLKHGEQIRDALRAAGQKPEWVVYPDESHGWLNPANRYDFARRMQAFLALHLQGP